MNAIVETLNQASDEERPDDREVVGPSATDRTRTHAASLARAV